MGLNFRSTDCDSPQKAAHPHQNCQSSQASRPPLLPPAALLNTAGSFAEIDNLLVKQREERRRPTGNKPLDILTTDTTLSIQYPISVCRISNLFTMTSTGLSPAEAGATFAVSVLAPRTDNATARFAVAGFNMIRSATRTLRHVVVGLLLR